MKRALRKQDPSNIPYSFQTEYVCDICNRACLSKAGHMRLHDGKQSQADYAEILPQQPTGFTCQFCDKICRSEARLKSHHTRVHKDYVNVNNKDKSCVPLCNKTCESEAGLLSHPRAHGTSLQTCRHGLLL